MPFFLHYRLWYLALHQSQTPLHQAVEDVALCAVVLAAVQRHTRRGRITLEADVWTTAEAVLAAGAAATTTALLHAFQVRILAALVPSHAPLRQNRRRPASACKVRYMQLWRACLAATGVASAAQDQRHLLTGLRVRVAMLTVPGAPYDATKLAAAVADTVPPTSVASLLVQVHQETSALGRSAASFDQALSKVEAAVPTGEEAAMVHRCVVERTGGAGRVVQHATAAAQAQVRWNTCNEKWLTCLYRAWLLRRRRSGRCWRVRGRRQRGQ